MSQKVQASMSLAEVRKIMKTVDYLNRDELREVIWDATPKQVLEVVIPVGYEKRAEELKGQLDEGKIVRFVVEGEGGGSWDLQMKKGKLVVEPAGTREPDVTMTSKSEVFMNMARGKQRGMTAYMTGKVKIKGELTLAMRLQPILLG
ncbi:MAG: SCP2 sterol-binding domain-containing protein [Nitrospirae bacterium]|nr:SCP2 sterol-binding domain-containing protein [Nitrospirota bacterium]